MNVKGPLKVRLLVCVWGQKYFDYLTAFSVPSWLAANNLPALAAKTELEIDILTRRVDGEAFKSSQGFADLRSVCPVNFVDIDDLIGHDMYSVTLSGAFGRGMIRYGEAMTDISFIFMNADFILSNGSLAHVGTLIERGETAIMAPSYRASEENITPVLASLISTNNRRLEALSKELVRLALSSPHPTTVAKTVTQSGCVTRRPNQLYWPVGENTVIAHHLLTFMLCIKPDRVVSHINSYCDYSFIQHFTSPSRLYTITDSDDLFMLELQSHNFERELISTGENSVDYVVQMSGRWVTALHLANLKERLVFHSGDLPADFETHALRTREFVTHVLEKLPAPLDHKGHPHWIGGLTNWRTRSGITIIPPEFNHPDNQDGLTTPASHTRQMVNWVRQINRRINDNFPAVPVWHFLWSVYGRFAREVRAQGMHGKILFVRDGDVPCGGVTRLAKNGIAELTRDDLMKTEAPPDTDNIRFAALAVHPDQLNKNGALLSALRARYPAITEVVIFSPLYLATLPQTSMPSSLVLRDIDAILPRGAEEVSLYLEGQYLHILAHSITLRLTALTEHAPRAAIVATALMAPVLILLGVAGSFATLLTRTHRRGVSQATGLTVKVRISTNA